MLPVKELVIISGKGGTGKTSISAALASCVKDKIFIDADVDASNLHLIFKPEVLRKEEFRAGFKASINNNCTKCGKCLEVCKFDAIKENYYIDPFSCEGCKACHYICEFDAIDFKKQLCGYYYISNTRFGKLVHAKLGIAEENSGILVSLLRKEAKELALKEKIPLIITDGPPGAACPVIASINNSNVVLIVTEPTMSGIHDMKRVWELTCSFKIKTMLCVNKYDLNIENTNKIKAFAKANNIYFAGSISYNTSFVNSMIASQNIVEFANSKAKKEIEAMWDKIKNYI